MKILHCVTYLLMTSMIPTEAYYNFRFPTPPKIDFGRFRPLFNAIFNRPSFFNHNAMKTRRPPPPLPPPMNPPLHPPMLAPIHAPVKGHSFEPFEESHQTHSGHHQTQFHQHSPAHPPPPSLMQAPGPQGNHFAPSESGFGSPKPESIIYEGNPSGEIFEADPHISNDVFEHISFLKDHMDLHNEQNGGQVNHENVFNPEAILKPHVMKAISRPHIQFAPPPQKFTQQSHQPVLEIHNFQPSDPVDESHMQFDPHQIKSPQPLVVKLKPIKMLSKPHKERPSDSHQHHPELTHQSNTRRPNHIQEMNFFEQINPTSNSQFHFGSDHQQHTNKPQFDIHELNQVNHFQSHLENTITDDVYPPQFHHESTSSFHPQNENLNHEFSPPSLPPNGNVATSFVHHFNPNSGIRGLAVTSPHSQPSSNANQGLTLHEENQNQALFINQKLEDEFSLLSSPDAGAIKPQISNQINDHVISQVPKVNAGVLPLANEAVEPPLLNFPPYV